MSEPSITDYAFVAVLTIGLIWAWVFNARRQGERNPEGTHKMRDDVSDIDKRVKVVERDVKAFGEQLDETATKADLAGVQREVEANRRAIDQVAKGVPGLMANQQDMAASIAKIEARGEANSRQLDMIYQVVVEKGMK